MSDLTPAADIAWRVAAGEAGSAGHDFIERGHLLIGILSLEKVRAGTPLAQDLLPRQLEGVRAERAELSSLLSRLGLATPDLRRALRRALGAGRGEKRSGSVSRSDACRKSFARAAELADGPTSCLHLLTALSEEPDAVLLRALYHLRVEPADLHQRALGFLTGEASRPAGPKPAPETPPPVDDEAVVPREIEPAEVEGGLHPTLREMRDSALRQHGIALRFEPEAERFLEQAGLGPDQAAGEPGSVLERFVRGPLRDLAQSGRLARHRAWRVVYDEGGIYLLPEAEPPG